MEYLESEVEAARHAAALRIAAQAREPMRNVRAVQKQMQCQDPSNLVKQSRNSRRENAKAGE